ncbi:hypothetical protein [Perlabentimonas gracilis]|uniref:hypothetical protein n=1 Tax=Perlabentimonas gracilis TaxID=2715279 RepID=UPI00140C713C|nr:hypothetical protein [Perlabentimonas gracilis]NHB67219.1 hypothetical protein [Perlabentimonas gracilis]
MITLVNYTFRLLLVFTLWLVQVQSATSQPSNIETNETLFITTDRDIYIAGEELAVSLSIVGFDDSSETSGVGYILVRNQNQKVVQRATVRFLHGRSTCSIELSDTLSSGYYQIVGFTNYLKNFGSNSFPSKQLVVVNRFDQEFISALSSSSNSIGIQNEDDLTSKTNAPEYTTRQGVQFQIETDSLPFNEIVSTSIVPKHFLLPPVNRPMKARGLYFERDNNGICYPKEKEGIYLSGSIRDLDTNTPIRGATIYLSTPDSLINLQYTHSDSLGNFCFHLSFAYMGKNVLLMPDPSSYVGRVGLTLHHKFELDDEFIPKSVTFSSDQANFIRTAQNVVLIQKLFGTKYFIPNSNNRSVTQKLPRVYTSPSYTYLLSDYQELDDFREIAREIIPQLRVRIRDTEALVSVMNTQESFNFFQNRPLMIINGMPFWDFSKVVRYGSKEIERIELVTLPWRFGEKLFHGIVAVFLKPNIDTQPLLPSTRIEHFVDSFCKEIEYNHEVSEMKSIPDFRYVLHWQTNLTVDQNKPIDVSFNTSHIRGEYVIVLNGYDEKGRKASTTDRFFVK